VSHWTEEELAELEDPDTWDWESMERHPGNPRHRSFVSVEFAAQEFQAVAKAAHASQVPLTEFIRAAAVAQAVAVGERASR
jgi:hypothetical protein